MSTNNNSDRNEKSLWKNNKVFYTGFIIFFSSIILSVIYMPIANISVIGFALILIGIIRNALRKGNMNINDGKEGEIDTAHQLSHIGDEYVVYNNIELSTSTGESQQIDHLVIGPNGIFHIETKHYVGEINFTPYGLTRNKGISQDPTGQVSRHEFIVKKVLNQNSIVCDVVGIINFSHKNSILQGSSPAFITVKLDRLLYTIQSYKAEKLIAREDVNAIAEAIKRSSRQLEYR